MGYNIDSIRTPVLDAWIRAGDVVWLHIKHGRDIPSNSFINDMLGDATNACSAKDHDRWVRINAFTWCGEWSGMKDSQDALKDIAQYIMGNVEAIMCLEGGDSYTGLLIGNGHVVECDVELRLVKPEGWQE